MSELNISKSVQSRFNRVAAEVAAEIESRTNSQVNKIAAAGDQDADWQRVYSYLADILKDSHVLFAKLARLQGDFAGEEGTKLERISAAVLTIGEELSTFSKAFMDGKYEMQQSEFVYGEEGGAPMKVPTEESGELSEESSEDVLGNPVQDSDEQDNPVQDSDEQDYQQD